MKARQIMDEMWNRIFRGEQTPEAKAFYDRLRKKGGYGQDKRGIYFQHPDGTRDYDSPVKP